MANPFQESLEMRTVESLNRLSVLCDKIGRSWILNILILNRFSS